MKEIHSLIEAEEMCTNGKKFVETIIQHLRETKAL